MDVHRDDLLRAVLDGHGDGHVVGIAAVHVLLAADLLHREDGKAGCRGQQVVGKLPLGNLVQAHRAAAELGHAGEHHAQLHAGRAHAALVQLVVDQLHQGRYVHLEVVGVLQQEGDDVPLAREHGLHGKVLVLVHRHDLPDGDVVPQIQRGLEVVLSHQRGVQRADGRAVHAVQTNVQLPQRLPCAALICAPRSAAGEHQRPLHIHFLPYRAVFFVDSASRRLGRVAHSSEGATIKLYRPN